MIAMLLLFLYSLFTHFPAPKTLTAPSLMNVLTRDRERQSHPLITDHLAGWAANQSPMSLIIIDGPCQLPSPQQIPINPICSPSRLQLVTSDKLVSRKES
ncbi:hypothetical protein P152DRAFT_81871 [Eremomyces bilateralis CBS 781.70]|uniref:Uncharacterized protein n=1 Tax=Eremomyces bilateralis CBS 781.70 TaxID=1392243 RepID=A0A6G1FYV5_9PEZI|nr:uncharacterized protein P152DRAFT_81871 [Eremomyces bilateralis CBS 781.70]KAF1810739.1 hypothetical protein P152DRAFT_81871 [Eremomyces bilateralis CBS 781.70]